MINIQPDIPIKKGFTVKDKDYNDKKIQIKVPIKSTIKK